MSSRPVQKSPVRRAAIHEFAPEEIVRTIESAGLLTLELEPSYACNLNCSYCYSSSDETNCGEMEKAEVSCVLESARELGAGRIILLGGEPLLYRGIRETIDEIRSLGMTAEIFTNGTLIDPDSAHFLWEREVAVTVKRNSTNHKTQDRIAGSDGASREMERGLRNLFDAGYPDEGRHLGVQTIICRDNIDEIEDLWRWARANDIEPYFECVTLQGRAAIGNIDVPPERARRVFERLSEIDRDEYGINWAPKPPIAAATCKRHLYSILVRPNGDVSPCVGIDLVVGNVGRDSLANILRENPVIRDLRNIHSLIKGPCSACGHSGECYGCRGNAWQVEGDYLASDPGCWMAGEKAPIERVRERQ